MFAAINYRKILEYRRILHLLLSLAAGILFLAACHVSARAAGGHTLIIPAEDGYGFNDCLEAHKTCGRIVADAWCEAHGLSSSLAFGRAEDVTGSIADDKAPSVEPGSFVVTCAE